MEGINNIVIGPIRMVIGFLTFIYFGSLSSQSPVSILEETRNFTNSYRQENHVSKALHYRFNKSSFLAVAESSEIIRFPVSTDSGKKELILQRHALLTPDYLLSTSDGIKFPNEGKYLFYQGYVAGDEDSKVALTYAEEKVRILILDEDGNYEINQIENDLYAGYYAHDHLERKYWECSLNSTIDVIEENNRTSRNYRSGQCVEIYLEIDFAMFQKKNSDLADTEAWALSLMNEVSILYIEWDIPLSVSQIHVYTSPDPFANAGNTSETLPVFRDSMLNKAWNGRLAHLLSGRNMGGGIAYLNQLCSNYNNVAISGNLNGSINPYPNYSWNVMVVAHEIGHNFGSPHTHDCAWNGNNTSIDGCGYSTGYGGCDGPIPPAGTIMSYCHLVNGVGIDLALGFGPQPGALILSRFQNANCSTGTSCPPVPPFNDVCSRAKNLDVLLSCNITIGKLIDATPSGTPLLSCGNGGAENDVWFKLEFPAVNSISIETKQIAGGLTDLILEVYSGTCNGLISIACDDNSGDNNHAAITINDPSLQGQTVYVRVIDSGSNEYGEFGICTYSNELPCNAMVDTLINLYDAAGGPAWNNNSGWVDGKNGVDCDYCQWYGITCNGSGQIVGLNLSNNNLVGTISPSLDGLTNIVGLDLSLNQLSGAIPDIWANLDQLATLNLQNNNLSGIIPGSFEDMNTVNGIYLDNNNLTTPFPQNLGYISSLRNFTASNNAFTGCYPQSFTSFCYKDLFDMSNNPGLPNNGNVTFLCDDGTGKDWDQDGYCYNIDDCDDYNIAINPGATEECDGVDNNCDGVSDEGHNSGPNVWDGPSNGGNWLDNANWTMGHAPLGCEDVEIGMVGPPITLSLPGEYNSHLKSISVGISSILNLGNGNTIMLTGGGNILNLGTINMNGYIQISNISGVGTPAIINDGTLNLINGLYIRISNIDDIGIYNQANGVINNDGSFDIYSNGFTSIGVKNEGSIYNTGYLYISGIFSGQHLLLAPNSIFESSGPRQNIYLSNFSEGQEISEIPKK